MPALSIPLLVLLLVIGFAVLRSRFRARSLPYPPTPPGHFVFGNSEELQSKEFRNTLERLAKRYGEIFHLSALGQHVVVLNTKEVIDELFNRRAQIYSSRPANTMSNLMGWGDINAAFLPYGSTWRSHRRVLQQGFSAHAVQTHCHQIQSEKMTQFLHDLLTSPDDFMHHTEKLLGAVIMRYVHGKDGNASDDPIFVAAAQAARNGAIATAPGRFLVNSFPVLRYLPEWFPGCYFHTFARENRELVREVVERGYEQAMRQTENESLIRRLDESRDKSETLSRQIVKEVCGTAYSAAAETTRNTLATFFLLMRENPDVQLKAHQEIARVLGANKLPEFGDRSDLPYVQAVYLEVMRWMPAAPLSVPHATMEDDVFKGYFIPKGSVVLGNLWVIVNDEKAYPNPRAFKPSRFLTPDGNLKNNTGINHIQAYGYGRRVCPGRHFADALVWRVIASVLAGFEVARGSKSDDAETVEGLEGMFDQGIVAHVAPFTCSITPRTPEMAKVIRGQNI